MNPPMPLRVGDLVAVSSGEPVTISSVSRRNWSIVARGDLGGNPVFVKQFITSRGFPLPGLFEAESQSADLLASALAEGALLDDITVRTPVASGIERLALIYRHADTEPIDESLRLKGDFDEGVWLAFCDRLRALLASCAITRSKRGGPDGLKRRGTSNRLSLSFKGLECRNIALDRRSGRVELFDLGPAYIGDTSQAAARILVSCLLLNWGWPLPRFLSGPPTQMYRCMYNVLRDLTDRQALAAELRFQYRDRLTGAQGSNILRRLLKRAVIASVGTVYVIRCQRLIHGS